MAAKIKLSDRVIVISGKDKGKIGIIKFIDFKNHKVIVEGLKLVKKHQKAIPDKNIRASIVEKESLIHISNIAILNFVTKKPDKVGFKFDSNKKVRYLKSNNKIID